MKQLRRKAPFIECFSQDSFHGYRPLQNDLEIIQSMAARVDKLEPLETISLEPKKIAHSKALRLGKTAVASLYTRDFVVVSVDAVIRGDACLDSAQQRLASFASGSGNGFVFGYGAHEISSSEDAVRAERMIEILSGLGVPVALVTSAARRPEEIPQRVVEPARNLLALV